MKEVNKKILGVLVALMAVAMLATPLVSAKPTAAANNSNFLSFVWHSEGGYSVPVEGYPKINPPWAEAGSPDVKVTHTQAVWYLNPDYDNYVQIGEDDPIPIDTVTGYEGVLYVQAVYSSPTYILMNYRVYEKIMWGDNYIEIMCLERACLELLAGPPFVSFSASGIFSGHGEIDGQKVQVTGIREGVLQLPTPGIMLDCTGTIRFLGKP